MFFKNKQPQPATDNYIVALDIGTEFVKALIAEVDGDDLKVVGVGRARQQVSDMHSGAIADIASVVQNCENALIEAEDEAGVQATLAIVGIAGELVKGSTNTIRYRRPQPNKPLDEAEMEFIIDKIHERAQLKAQREIALETGNKEAEIKLVNSAIVGIHIDGYKVSNPIGFQGKDVAIQIYTAFAPTVHIGAIERVANELALDLLAVAAEPFAVARSVIGTDSSSNFTAILADVGGGTTDIAVVNDGGVEGTKMFGIGGRSFTNQIANEMSLSYKNAEKLKLSLNGENLKSEVGKQALESVEKTLEVWLSGVELALGDFDNVDYLPNKILLCGGGASLSNLADSLRKTDWWQDLPFSKKPVVKHIQPEEVSGITDKTGKITDHTFITAMGLLRVGYDTLGSADNSNESFKDKLNKILRN
ncbi:MAG: cell division FtsA domain-containing protein [bacterium]|nr:cell division FtsA domain-containing protein [bacterium]